MQSKYKHFIYIVSVVAILSIAGLGALAFQNYSTTQTQQKQITELQNKISQMSSPKSQELSNLSQLETIPRSAANPEQSLAKDVRVNDETMNNSDTPSIIKNTGTEKELSWVFQDRLITKEMIEVGGPLSAITLGKPEDSNEYINQQVSLKEGDYIDKISFTYKNNNLYYSGHIAGIYLSPEIIDPRPKVFDQVSKVGGEAIPSTLKLELNGEKEMKFNFEVTLNSKLLGCSFPSTGINTRYVVKITGVENMTYEQAKLFQSTNKVKFVPMWDKIVIPRDTANELVKCGFDPLKLPSQLKF